MADVNWTMELDAKQVDAALDKAASRYNKLTKAAKETGDASAVAGEKGAKGAKAAGDAAVKATGGFGGLKTSVVDVVTGVLAISTAARIAGALWTGEIDKARKSAELFGAELTAINKITLGMKGSTGGNLALEIKNKLVDRPTDASMIIPASERLALASAMKGANESVTAEQAVAGVEAASKAAGVLDAGGREQLVKNIATVQKLDTGMSQEDIADFAFRAVQEGVDVSAYDKTFQRAQAVGLKGEDLQKVLALAVGGGKGGEGGKLADAVVGKIEEGLRKSAGSTVMQNGQVVGVTGGTSKYQTAGEGLGSILADPSVLEGVQAAGLKNAMAAGVTMSGLTGGDVIGETMGRADESVFKLRRRLSAESMDEQSRKAGGDANFDFETSQLEIAADMRSRGESEAQIKASLAMNQAGQVVGNTFGDVPMLAGREVTALEQSGQDAGAAVAELPGLKQLDAAFMKLADLAERIAPAPGQGFGASPPPAPRVYQGGE